MGISAGRRRVLGSAIGVAQAFSVLACGQVESRDDGNETRLWTCTNDAECASLGSAFACVTGECRRPGGGLDGGRNDFVGCAIAPPSVCTLAETCNRIACGGLEYDPYGCQRAPCTTDADCDEGDRCTSVPCRDTNSCSYMFGPECVCGGPAVCRPGAFCNPVAEPAGGP